MFTLDPRLENDTLCLGRLPLSTVLMHRDANYPWFLLVPRRRDVREIFELDPRDQRQLLGESAVLAEVICELFRPDKLNVAALGNIVPQLHIHHIARYVNDSAWPGPVWGAVPALEYTDEAMMDRARRMRAVLSDAGLIWE